MESKVFLPSNQDYRNQDYLFDSNGNSYDLNRWCEVTDWAIASGSEKFLSNGPQRYKKNGRYYSRSPFPSYNYSTYAVDYNGAVIGCAVNATLSVRPAINLSSL